MILSEIGSLGYQLLRTTERAVLRKNCSMPGMAVRKMRRLFASYHRHGTKDSSWPSQAKTPRFTTSNHRTGHCARASHRAPVRGFRALASCFSPVTRLVSYYTRRPHYLEKHWIIIGDAEQDAGIYQPNGGGRPSAFSILGLLTTAPYRSRIIAGCEGVILCSVA